MNKLKLMLSGTFCILSVYSLLIYNIYYLFSPKNFLEIMTSTATIYAFAIATITLFYMHFSKLEALERGEKLDIETLYNETIRNQINAIALENTIKKTLKEENWIPIVNFSTKIINNSLNRYCIKNALMITNLSIASDKMKELERELCYLHTASISMISQDLLRFKRIKENILNQLLKEENLPLLKEELEGIKCNLRAYSRIKGYDFNFKELEEKMLAAHHPRENPFV